MAVERSLRRSDIALLVGYCLALFGVCLVADRPLTLHEAVLPQSAREMLADGDWVVPKKGGEPWLESPPLPQWCTVAVASVFGRCDAVWIVRIGPVLAATFSVCLLAWMACVWYGRTIGLLSGLVLATTCEFTRYAWLAEDEIYLCAVVTAVIAWFVKLEFRGQTFAANDLPSSLVSMLFGSRSLSVMLFFVLLGATNLVKGLIFGTAMCVIPIGGWLLWNRDWPRISRYCWVWGAVLFAGVLAAWPLAACWRNPDVVDVWMFDLGGRVSGEYTDINQPLWYYPVNMLWMLAPWTFVIPFGLAATWPAVKSERNSPARFLWMWALAVPLVFSIPGGKHHHYLLHALAPWAVLAAIGLDRCRAWMATWPRWLVHPATGAISLGVPIMAALMFAQQKQLLPGPPGLFLSLMLAMPLAAAALTWGLHHPQPRTAVATVFTALMLVYAGGHWYSGQYVDVHRHDVTLLKEARQLQQSRDVPIVVDLSRSSLSGFIELFYLPAEAKAIHNTSFLADEKLPNEVLLLTRQSEIDEVGHYGEIQVLRLSERPLKPKDEASRLTLLAVRLHDDLARRSTTGIHVTPMQAMLRADGPVLR